MPGAHKIGAAISGPRITGGNFMDTTLFLKFFTSVIRENSGRITCVILDLRWPDSRESSQGSRTEPPFLRIAFRGTKNYESLV